MFNSAKVISFIVYSEQITEHKLSLVEGQRSSPSKSTSDKMSVMNVFLNL